MLMNWIQEIVFHLGLLSESLSPDVCAEMPRYQVALDAAVRDICQSGN